MIFNTINGVRCARLDTVMGLEGLIIANEPCPFWIEDVYATELYEHHQAGSAFERFAIFSHLIETAQSAMARAYDPSCGESDRVRYLRSASGEIAVDDSGKSVALQMKGRSVAVKLEWGESERWAVISKPDRLPSSVRNLLEMINNDRVGGMAPQSN